MGLYPSVRGLSAVRSGETVSFPALVFCLGGTAGGCGGLTPGDFWDEADGSAGTAGSADATGPDALSPSAARVLITEIMYHPVVDDAPDSSYEFVEIYNAT